VSQIFPLLTDAYEYVTNRSMLDWTIEDCMSRLKYDSNDTAKWLSSYLEHMLERLPCDPSVMTIGRFLNTRMNVERPRTVDPRSAMATHAEVSTDNGDAIVPGSMIGAFGPSNVNTPKRGPLRKEDSTPEVTAAE
jgi:hypothetical protein